MAAQKGDSLLIKVGDAASPEVFTTVGGLRTKSITLNSETVDISDADSTSKMRELLEAAGMISFAVSGTGVFKDTASEETVRGFAFAQSIRNYQIVVPGQGTWEGAFQITQIEFAGEYNGEVTWSISMESAGVVTYTAE